MLGNLKDIKKEPLADFENGIGCRSEDNGQIVSTFLQKLVSC
jgi:hypothetical protein